MLRKFKDEFKTFAIKGNVMDMAVGVIIGSAFGKIVTSLVNDIIMPMVGVLISGMDLKDMKFILRAAVTDVDGNVIKPEASVMYGNFIMVVIDFLIVSLSIFIFIKIINNLRNITTTLIKLNGNSSESPDEDPDSVSDSAPAPEAAAKTPPSEPEVVIPPAASEPSPGMSPEVVELLTEIRDLMKKGKDT